MNVVPGTLDINIFKKIRRYCISKSDAFLPNFCLIFFLQYFFRITRIIKYLVLYHYMSQVLYHNNHLCVIFMNIIYIVRERGEGERCYLMNKLKYEWTAIFVVICFDIKYVPFFLDFVQYSLDCLPRRRGELPTRM